MMKFWTVPLALRWINWKELRPKADSSKLQELLQKDGWTLLQELQQRDGWTWQLPELLRRRGWAQAQEADCRKPTFQDFASAQHRR